MFLPQDDEPAGVPSFRGADMLLTANAGYLAEITGGRDKKKELSEAIDEVINTGRTDGPAVMRVCGEE